MGETSAALALSTVALVPTVFGSVLPPLAVVHDEPDASGTQRRAVITATGTAAFVVIAAAAITKSPAVLAAGGLAVVAYSCLYHRAALGG